MLGHEWEASAQTRVQGHGCHTCANRKIPEKRSLGARYPDIAAEWDQANNGKLTPWMVAPNSNDLRAWICAAGNHPYLKRVDRRVAGSGCAKCAHREVSLNQTDVSTAYPLIAVDWDWDKNPGVNPHEILPGTTLYNWKCRLGHEARQSVPHRVKSRGCIHCPPGMRSAASQIAA
jgi:hypothetical protein